MRSKFRKTERKAIARQIPVERGIAIETSIQVRATIEDGDWVVVVATERLTDGQQEFVR